MASLRVPDTGLQLESSAGASPGIPAQAFALTLSDNVIEDMIKCVQNGEDIQLSLGSSPTFLFGSQSHTPAPSTEQYPLDIFLTKPFESTKRAARIPTTSSLWQKPTSPRPDLAEHSGRPRNTTSSSASSMRDSDLETLQNSMAAMEAKKVHTNILESAPKHVSTRPAPKSKSKHLSSIASYNNKGTSNPNSPALTAVGSPSLNQGYGASHPSLEKAKGQRTMIVHELAAADRSTDYLESKWSGQGEDFKTTLEKVADYLPASDAWTLKKLYWKELDVWKYDYDSQDERQNAIDRAVKIFDRTRLGLEEPQWEKLLPREERGKGKHLSKVQANIAKVSAIVAAPKIKVDGASDTGAEDVLKLDGGESMARSSSQPLPAKKKPASKLLSAKPKASTPRPTASKPTKERALPQPAAKPGKFLSEEFVMDSDSDSSEKPMASVAAVARSKKPSPAPRPAPKPVERPAVTNRPKQKAKPIERPVERAKPVPSPQPAKRRREEDVEESESSSSSGRPLAKRIKPKAATEKAPIKPSVSLKQRPAHTDSHGSRGSGTNGSLSFKSTKNTSPIKSSPLASSPPTNASDLEQQRRHPPPDPIVGRKRKVSTDISDDGLSSKGSTTSSADSSIVAKRRKVIEPALIKKASVFKSRYAKYANLHHEISSMDHPPPEKIQNLASMRAQLEQMKKEIYRDCAPAIAVA